MPTPVDEIQDWVNKGVIAVVGAGLTILGVAKTWLGVRETRRKDHDGEKTQEAADQRDRVLTKLNMTLEDRVEWLENKLEDREVWWQKVIDDERRDHRIEVSQLQMAKRTAEEMAMTAHNEAVAARNDAATAHSEVTALRVRIETMQQEIIALKAKHIIHPNLLIDKGDGI